MNTPNGLAEIKATFGNVSNYITSAGTLLPEWETEYLTFAELAFPLRLSWEPSVTVTKMLCHRLLAPTIEGMFSQMVQNGLAPQVKTFGGCFAWRHQRGVTDKISTHAWGIALDLNPETNQQGTAGDMSAGLVKFFEDAGFVWGGNFAGVRQDPMHFQFASGY